MVNNDGAQVILNSPQSDLYGVANFNDNREIQVHTSDDSFLGDYTIKVIARYGLTSPLTIKEADLTLSLK